MVKENICPMHSYSDWPEQVDALSPFLSNFALKCAVRKVEENKRA
jgi:hypothetical protein